MSITLPTHAHLIDPATGEPLVALMVRDNGQPVWPMLGGSEDDDVDGDDEDETPPAKDDKDEKDEKPAEVPGDGDDEDETPDKTWDVERLLRKNKSQAREAQRLRAERKTLTEQAEARKADLEELEALRDAKRSKEEKAELAAQRATEGLTATQAENEKLKIQLATGIEDEDELDELKIKGDNLAERIASATRLAEKYKLGKFAVVEEVKGARTPGAKNLKGGLVPNGKDDDDEADPKKLAARISRGYSL